MCDCFYLHGQARGRDSVGSTVFVHCPSILLDCEPPTRPVPRLKALPFNITTIQAYATTTDYNDDDFKDFYDQLQKVIDQAPKKDIFIVQGDWNTKIGEDASKNWKETCGQYCNPETIKRGLI